MEVSTLWVDSWLDAKPSGRNKSTLRSTQSWGTWVSRLTHSLHRLITLFSWTLPLRVWAGRLPSRLNFGKSQLSRLIHSLHRLISSFPLNYFATGLNRSTPRSTQPWKKLCLSRLIAYFTGIFALLWEWNFWIEARSPIIEVSQGLQFKTNGRLHKYQKKPWALNELQITSSVPYQALTSYIVNTINLQQNKCRKIHKLMNLHKHDKNHNLHHITTVNLQLQVMIVVSYT